MKKFDFVSYPHDRNHEHSLKKKSIKVLLPSFEVYWIDTFCTSYFTSLTCEEDFADEFYLLNDLFKDPKQFEYFLPREVINFIISSCFHALLHDSSSSHRVYIVLSDLYVALDYALFDSSDK